MDFHQTGFPCDVMSITGKWVKRRLADTSNLLSQIVQIGRHWLRVMLSSTRSAPCSLSVLLSSTEVLALPRVSTRHSHPPRTARGGFPSSCPTVTHLSGLPVSVRIMSKLFNQQSRSPPSSCPFNIWPAFQWNSTTYSSRLHSAVYWVLPPYVLF